MSDVPQPPERQAVQTAPAPAKETSPLRLIVLLLVFGVLLVGFLYDYTIARPAFNTANKIVMDLLEEKMPDPNNDGGVTQAEIQDLLGRAPKSVTQLENGQLELYSWRSGVPYRTYDLHVAYMGQKLPLLYSAWTDGEVDKLTEQQKAERLPPKTIIPRAMSDDELKDFEPRRPTGASGPGTGGGGKKRDRKAKTPREEEPAPSGGQDAGAKSLEPATELPKADEPAPTMEPGKEEPAPPAEPTTPPAEPAKTEPAEEQPPAGDQPAKEEPAEPPAGGGQR